MIYRQRIARIAELAKHAQVLAPATFGTSHLSVKKEEQAAIKVLLQGITDELAELSKWFDLADKEEE